MLRSIATVSLGGTLMEKLNAIAAAGFDGVEIFENDLLYFDGSPRDVKQIAADLGLSILLFQPFRDFEAAPRARMAKNFDRAERPEARGNLGRIAHRNDLKPLRVQMLTRDRLHLGRRHGGYAIGVPIPVVDRELVELPYDVQVQQCCRILEREGK